MKDTLKIARYRTLSVRYRTPYRSQPLIHNRASSQRWKATGQIQIGDELWIRDVPLPNQPGSVEAPMITTVFIVKFSGIGPLEREPIPGIEMRNRLPKIFLARNADLSSRAKVRCPSVARPVAQ